MKMNNCLLVALVFTASLVFYNVQAQSQEDANRLTQLEALLTAQNWVEADRETIALIRNNPQNLSCANLRAMNQLWVQNSKGKYGFTPQLEIWKMRSPLTSNVK